MRFRDEMKNLPIVWRCLPRDTYEDNPGQGEIAFMKSMVRYYYMVRDTARYFAHAQRLMDSRYMPLTIDSLNAMDDAAFKVKMAPETFGRQKSGTQHAGQGDRGHAAFPVHFQGSQ